MLDRPSAPLQKALADDARTDRQAVLIAIGIVAAFTVVNSLSGITEYRRIGVETPAANFWIYEISSLIIHVPILFALSWFTRRFPLTADGWPRLAAIYVAGAFAYSFVHVVGMVLIRKAVFAVFFGEAYRFVSPDRPLAIEAMYEFRKDALAFVMFAGLFALWRSRADALRERDAAKREASETNRLTLKCGGRTIYLDAASIDYAKAAGNYVEIAAGGRTHLARITMAALEEQLAGAGAPVIRTHRSWLVNKSKIAEIVPAGDGDVTIRLKTGEEAPGSRRYRERLGE
ncbi:MAG TPA: LytTR family DNA-binding domain-containing protein [Parvularculaceae bacterium]|nr:LytTR family DNA-binding domain-containing protein [Parvularculaceae bacterium]